ncbi:hypothetical protein REPUB_Repub05bG0195500 [Reevesia pubescens]
MIYLLILIWISINSSFAQQYYDPSNCLSDTNFPGSRYTCNSKQQSYNRANQHFRFQNLLNISTLFQKKSDELLDLNNIASPAEILKPENDVEIGVKLHVPLRCACPDNFTSTNGVKYLVTYPLLEEDGITPIKPNINLNILDSPPPTPGFLPTITVEKTKNTKLRNLYIAGSIVGFFLVAVALLACGLSFPPSDQTGRSSHRFGQIGRSSTNSCLSPNLLAGIKFSLYNYVIEDIRKATNEFSEDSMIGEHVYRGLVDNANVMIKQMKFEDTRHVAPEYPEKGSASKKVDIFAFEVILLELISGRESTEGILLKDSIRLLGGGTNEGGCFEQLRSFIDPSLEEDYLLAEVLCLAVLAKACIADDHLRRPSMDDILKVLGRIV